MHAVVALALPAVEAFDLAIPSQVFGDQVIHAEQYTFTVCAPAAGLVPSTAGYAIRADRGLDALADADTVVVPGYLPLDDPGETVCSALREAAARGARVVSVCTGAFALRRGRPARSPPGHHALAVRGRPRQPLPLGQGRPRRALGR